MRDRIADLHRLAESAGYVHSCEDEGDCDCEPHADRIDAFADALEAACEGNPELIALDANLDVAGRLVCERIEQIDPDNGLTIHIRRYKLTAVSAQEEPT